ncbi:MAG: FprA family A-type flavoprotein [Prevotellaceae bacterium]|jgi:flavorubredoxin|nr:FprA family A-type flavoprotein [Prevotellaceae bacterium]
MYAKVNITDKVFWLGCNDRRKQLFENMWPLPNGVAYNSYLIIDEKTALVDTVDMVCARDFIERVESHLGNRELDYLIVNHMELDHTGEVKDVIARYPNVKIVGNRQTHKMLNAYFGLTENLHEAADGDMLDLGHHKLQFVLTPWVHWPETMMTYDTTESILFSGDAFGSFGTLDGGIFDDEINFEKFYEDDMRRYYSNIVGKYSNMVQKAFAKLQGVSISYICSTHGPIWRKNPAVVLDLYNKWSRYESEEGVVIVFASMYNNTEQVADYIARKVAENGIKNIRVHDVSKTHISYLISEIWKYNGVMLGSCAYNSEMFPLMERLCRELEHMGVKNKKLGLFGSFTWSGGGVKNLKKFAENISWEQVSEPVEISGIPNEEKLSACDALAKAMAEKVKQ